MTQLDPHTAVAAQQRRGRARLVAGSAERGFTLVEVLVVMLIIGMLVAVGIRSLGGTKSRQGGMKARTVAVQLAEAASQFQRDHGGRVPGQLGTTAGNQDWNTARTSPIDRANGNRPYLKAASVEALADGAISIENASGQTFVARPSTNGRVRYAADTSRNVFIVVAYSMKNGTRTPTCYASPFGAQSVAALVRTAGSTSPC